MSETFEKQIAGFKKMRNACDEIITAMEKEDEEALETAMGKFLIASMILQELS